MAIASGFGFQRVRTSVTTGIIAASFVFAGVPADEEFLKQGGLNVQSAHHRDGVQALQAITVDIVQETVVVVPGGQHVVVSAAREREPAASFLLQSEDIED